MTRIFTSDDDDDGDGDGGGDDPGRPDRSGRLAFTRGDIPWSDEAAPVGLGDGEGAGGGGGTVAAEDALARRVPPVRPGWTSCPDTFLCLLEEARVQWGIWEGRPYDDPLFRAVRRAVAAKLLVRGIAVTNLGELLAPADGAPGPVGTGDAGDAALPALPDALKPPSLLGLSPLATDDQLRHLQDLALDRRRARAERLRRAFREGEASPFGLREPLDPRRPGSGDAAAPTADVPCLGIHVAYNPATGVPGTVTIAARLSLVSFTDIDLVRTFLPDAASPERVPFACYRSDRRDAWTPTDDPKPVLLWENLAVDAAPEAEWETRAAAAVLSLTDLLLLHRQDWVNSQLENDRDAR